MVRNTCFYKILRNNVLFTNKVLDKENERWGNLRTSKVVTTTYI